MLLVIRGDAVEGGVVQWLGLPIWVVVLVGVVVLIGSLVQSTMGLGLGILAAPVVVLIEPSLVPVMLLLLAMPVGLTMSWRDRKYVDWGVIAWALPMRVPGTALGAWLVTAFSDDALGLTVSVLVLVGVALSLRTVRITATPGALAAAGFASGVTGTAAAIGAPPMAIVLSGRPSRQARASMSVFFFVGAVLSLAWFAAMGQVARAAWVLGLCYLPIVLITIPVGARLYHRWVGDTFQRVVLGLCAATSAVLLVRSLIGLMS